MAQIQLSHWIPVGLQWIMHLAPGAAAGLGSMFFVLTLDTAISERRLKATKLWAGCLWAWAVLAVFVATIAGIAWLINALVYGIPSGDFLISGLRERTLKGLLLGALLGGFFVGLRIIESYYVSKRQTRFLLHSAGFAQGSGA